MRECIVHTCNTELEEDHPERWCDGCDWSFTKVTEEEWNKEPDHKWLIREIEAKHPQANTSGKIRLSKTIKKLMKGDE